MKKGNAIVNSVMGAFAGVFAGDAIYTVWEFRTHPELYAMQSAPWYTTILLHGVFTIGILLICLVIKAILHHRSK